MSLWAAFYGRQPRNWAVFAGCIGACVILFIADLSATASDIPLAYIFPLLICMFMQDTRMSWYWINALITITFAGHILGCVVIRPESHFCYYALADRAFCSVAIMATALCIDPKGAIGSIPTPPSTSSSSSSSTEPERWLRYSLACCVLAMALIAGADVISPARFNFSILYVCPLVWAIRWHSRRVVWLILLVAIALVRVGYLYGPYPPLAQRVPTLLANRILVRLTLVTLTLVADYLRKRRSLVEDSPELRLQFAA